ncbi:unnamed protein product [Prunus armeniaca]
MKSEGRVELTGEGTSERFDFRASSAVCSPQDDEQTRALLRRFPTRANGNQAISGTTNGRKGDSCPGDLKHSLRPFPEVELRYRSMSDSESFSEREPNAFDEESSESLFDSDVEAAGPDAEEGSDTDVEILGERPSSVPIHGIGKGLMTAPVPLSIVYSDGRHVGLGAPGDASGSHQPEASTSGRGEPAAEPSNQPRV